MKFGVVVFPGSNCDHDVFDALKRHLRQDVVFLWHKNHSLEGADVIVLPGGFAYGDYLRTGAIARFSPIMKEVIGFAQSGRPVLGICNGFQILLESGLLPGAMLRNSSLRFVCKFVNLEVTNNESIFSRKCHPKQVLKIPIAHNEGNYYVNDSELEEMESNNQIVFRYCDKEGIISEASNPNGSKRSIAGIINKKGNILGLMPHPERACERLLGSDDGKFIFNSIIGN